MQVHKYVGQWEIILSIFAIQNEWMCIQISRGNYLSLTEYIKQEFIEYGSVQFTETEIKKTQIASFFGNTSKVLHFNHPTSQYVLIAWTDNDICLFKMFITRTDYLLFNEKRKI